jgi:hypothetical protein
MIRRVHFLPGGIKVTPLLKNESSGEGIWFNSYAVENCEVIYFSF